MKGFAKQIVKNERLSVFIVAPDEDYNKGMFR